ncbi:hypothetical protein ACOSP7_023832 [Xanthoceras sorbifolium]
MKDPQVMVNLYLPLGWQNPYVDPRNKLNVWQVIMTVNETNTNFMSELDAYLQEKVLPNAIYFDILIWWKANASKYLILFRVARDVLDIPVSTVASESAFSTGGRVVSPHRSRLHPNTLEVLMCAQN